MVASRRFFVSGKVQGVWFRESTRRQAVRLGIDGHAINLSDGRVEVIATGGAEAMAELERWLAEGPPLAVVDQVEVESYVGSIKPGFTTG